MPVLRLVCCLAALLAAIFPASGALLWSANFESYNTSSGTASLVLSTTGANDTFSSVTTSSTTLASFSAEVRPYSGDNALYLSETGNGTSGTAALRLLQSSLTTLGTTGAMVISFDLIRTSTLSCSLPQEARTASGRSGSTVYNSAPAKDTWTRVTIVINRTGAAITLPGSLGTLADNSLAAYCYNGSVYSSLTTSANVSSTSITGFSTGISLSALASGAKVDAYLDNFGVWNSLTDTLNGTSVLSLAPGTSMPTDITWHVDGVNGNNAFDGHTASSSFATIQHAVDLALPGDTVLVHPGIYYENVVLTRSGTISAPITLMADQVQLDRVIITGAVRSIREKTAPAWELVDASLGLYRTPLTYQPTRVLASRADLLPYPNLDDLKAFRFLEDDYPGHKHGYAWDSTTQQLYVRLRADGKYGPTTPNSAIMAVSPPTGGGTWGYLPVRAEDFNVAVKTTGSAYVIIDGFTFETPGIAAVYTTASDLTVRNCWFFGCHTAVAGAESSTQAGFVDRVTVEQCYSTHYPAFADIEDTIHDEAAAQLKKTEDYQKHMFWQRKGGFLPVSKCVGRAFSYESGFIRRMGNDWIVRNNHFYEMFEALSSSATSWSSGAQIYGNRFERLCDNAIETEDHAQNLNIYSNLIIDTFEAFSWQPLNGIPLPGPVFIHDNTIVQTSSAVTTWNTANCHGGNFKIGISDDTMWDSGIMGTLPRDVAEAPGGFWVTHNTVLVPQGRIFTLLNPTTRSYRGFNFFNNVIGSYTVAYTETLPTSLVYDYNVAGPCDSQVSTAQKQNFTVFCGSHGLSVTSSTDLGLTSLANGGLALSSSSPAIGRGLTVHTLTLPDGTSLLIPDTAPLRQPSGAIAFQNAVGPQPR